jgi:predicted HicB family RNase H-like nuclease
MSKRKAVDFGALSQAIANPIEPIKKLEAKAQGVAPSRAGKVQIGVHVDPDKRARLKIASVKAGRSVADLMEEGLDHVLAKYE